MIKERRMELTGQTHPHDTKALVNNLNLMDMNKVWDLQTISAPNPLKNI